MLKYRIPQIVTLTRCIGVESELNAGSKFWIEVPCHPICCSEKKNSVYLMS